MNLNTDGLLKNFPLFTPFALLVVSIAWFKHVPRMPRGDSSISLIERMDVLKPPPGLVLSS